MSAPKSVKRPSLRIEQLENRINQSVAQVWFSGTSWVFKTDNSSTSLEITQSGSNVKVSEVGTSHTWSALASSVKKVEMQGGSGNDRFVDSYPSLPVLFFGNGGNDTLIGGDAADELQGGDGNDHLNGRGGADKLFGQNGDDVLIAVDSAYADYAEGGNGNDTVWVDKSGSTTDSVYGTIAGDKVQEVASFANGADRTLNGDRLSDPAKIKSSESYKAFTNRPLFSSSGPSMDDINQGQVGDCYFLAGLGAIAQDSKQALVQNIVDFDDGTYGVRLGSSFYRVDNDLVVSSQSSTSPYYAGLGKEGSMWVAVAEKAFAYYRTGANSFASIEGGSANEAQKAFGSTSTGNKSIQSYASGTALVNDMYARWNTYQAVCIGFDGVKKASSVVPKLIMDHAYTVVRFNKDSSGTITGVVLRNPWGTDGGTLDGANDGYVTVTPAELMRLTGNVYWGRV